MKRLLVLLLIPSVVIAEEPAESWARYEAAEQQRIQTHALNSIASSLDDQNYRDAESTRAANERMIMELLYSPKYAKFREALRKQNEEANPAPRHR